MYRPQQVRQRSLPPPQLLLLLLLLLLLRPPRVLPRIPISHRMGSLISQ